MRFAVFFLIVLTVLAAGHGYMAWRLSAPYEPGSRARKRIRYATLVVVLIIVGSFVVRVAGTEGAARVGRRKGGGGRAGRPARGRGCHATGPGGSYC